MRQLKAGKRKKRQRSVKKRLMPDCRIFSRSGAVCEECAAPGCIKNLSCNQKAANIYFFPDRSPGTGKETLDSGCGYILCRRAGVRACREVFFVIQPQKKQKKLKKRVDKIRKSAILNLMRHESDGRADKNEGSRRSVKSEKSLKKL
jgi:hypothetical protein